MAHLTSELDDGLLILTLDRREKHNALTFEMLEALEAAVEHAATDDRVGCVVLTGAGTEAFSSGADLGLVKELLSLPGGAAAFRKVQRELQALFTSLERLEKPTIAAIEGHCLGGGLELALACDLRVASSDAKFGMPEARLGMIPDLGGTTRLARAIGATLAKEWIFTGRTYPTVRALELGMVNELVVPGDALTRARDLGREVLRSAPVALRWAKQIIDAAISGTVEEGLALEQHAMTEVFHSGQLAEGLDALQARRPPVFRKP